MEKVKDGRDADEYDDAEGHQERDYGEPAFDFIFKARLGVRHRMHRFYQWDIPGRFSDARQY